MENSIVTDSNNVEVCSVCGVKILGGRTVQFSSGPTGDRARLYARVCQFIKDERKANCINQDSDVIGQITTRDAYGDGKDIQFPDFNQPLT